MFCGLRNMFFASDVKIAYGSANVKLTTRTIESVYAMCFEGVELVFGFTYERFEFTVRGRKGNFYFGTDGFEKIRQFLRYFGNVGYRKVFGYVVGDW